MILHVDDDSDDRYLIQEAFEELDLNINLRQVIDGQDLMDYLLLEGKYVDASLAPKPDLILLDLNMPRMSGREALVEIKRSPELWHVPIVVLTTSSSPEDIHHAYSNGASSYIAKPVSFDGLSETVKVLAEYWFNLSKLPGVIK